jgi:hypothetical protein
MRDLRDPAGLMTAVCGTLARHLPAHSVRGLEADLRALAGARERAGDSDGQALIEGLAAALVSSRPELFGH